MYDILVIGSGLSASSFLNGLNKKKRKIGIIFPPNLKTKNTNKKQNLYNYILKNLPPRFNKKKDIVSVEQYFVKNNIILDDKISIFGSLNPGGVSNYWGGSCEFLEQNDIKFLNKKNRKILTQLFSKIYEENNFSGQIGFKNLKSFNNNIKNKNKTFNKIITNLSNQKFNFFDNCIAQNSKTKKILSPNILLNKKNSRFEKLQYFVYKIQKLNNSYLVYCENNRKKIIIKTKKLILAAGTISTTKLICEMLNINKSLRVFHNPMLFGLFLLKEKIPLDNFSSSKLACKIFSKNQTNYSTVNFRSSSPIIKNKILNDFFFMKNGISKKFYEYFQNNLLFFNLYLDSNLSNINLKLNKNNFLYLRTTDNKNYKIRKELLKVSKMLFEYLHKNNLIFSFKLNLIPKIGHDNHYIGTIPINGKDKNLTLSENCELKDHKNLFIVDGSAIPKNNSKFPTGLIMANALRIGKIV